MTSEAPAANYHLRSRRNAAGTRILFPFIGLTDVKDLQEGGDGTPEARERWLGSIDVEIYKDGAPWVVTGQAGPVFSS